MRIRVHVLILACAAIAVGAAAQSRDVPTLTTDDVINARRTAPRAESPLKPTSPQHKSSSSQSEAASATAERQPRPGERAWNEALRQARAKLKDLERSADQTELEIARLRSAQFDPTRPQAPEDSGRINAQVADLTAKLKALRAEAKAAQERVDALLAEGEAKGYEVETIELQKKNGEPNLAGYRQRFAELKTELHDATARAEVLQLRINNIYGEQRRNENGDNFYLGRLRAERAEVAAELDRVRARIAELTQELARVRQEALLAGVPPGDLQ